MYGTICNLTGTLEIRDGIHSLAPLLKRYTKEEAESESRVQDQPLGGFVSQEEDGLYIRLIKPINKGYLQFVYGVFTQVNVTDKGKGDLISQIKHHV